MSNEDVRKLIREGDGYAKLEMHEEAKAAYRLALYHPDAADKPCISPLLYQLIEGRFEEALQEGMQLLDRLARSDRPARDAFWLTALSYSYLGRPQEALQLYRQAVPPHGKSKVHHHYQMACFQSQAGEFSGALGNLRTALEADYCSKVFLDLDLVPLWEHLAWEPMTRDAADILQGRSFERLLQSADAAVRAVEFDALGYWQMPQEFRPLLRIGLPDHWFLVDEPARLQDPVLARRFDAWVRQRVEDCRELIATAVKRAWKEFPHLVVARVEESLTTHGLVSARHALFHALAKRPNTLPMFLSEPKFAPLRPVLEEIAYSLWECPDYPNYCQRFLDCWKLAD